MEIFAILTTGRRGRGADPRPNARNPGASGVLRATARLSLDSVWQGAATADSSRRNGRFSRFATGSAIRADGGAP